ncbi:MAG TPA: DUF433 domain-containing protein [Pirellulales bacterium]|nr:DUF433 domain-containing protein [Pirellulales bacterium]
MIFVDTWGWISLADRSDSHHAQASAKHTEFSESGTKYVTSDYVVGELITYLYRAVDAMRAAVAASVADEPQPPRVEEWVERLVFDPAVLPGERIVKGTALSAEVLVAEIPRGRSESELMARHPELTPPDLAALRSYARLPEAFRLTFGAWADEAEELDKFLEERRLQRQVHDREIGE